MIKMTRLRLINWHNFQDDTIDFIDSGLIEAKIKNWECSMTS